MCETPDRKCVCRQVVDEETVDSPPLAGGALQRAPAPLPFSLGDGAMLDLSLKGG